MQPLGSFYVPAHVALALAYLACTLFYWRAARSEASPILAVPGAPRASAGKMGMQTVAVVGFVALLVLAHGALIGQAAFEADGGMRFGFALALSTTLWLAVVLTWIQGFFLPLRGLFLGVLPAAAVAAILPAVFPGAALGDEVRSSALRIHLIVAILAYSVLTLAAIHALLMSALDRHLHAALREGTSTSGFFARLPPLLVLESLLFRMLLIGFALLTATVLTGVVFSEQLFGRALRFDHKTVFAIASWVVFGALLVGRYAFGWRGRIALRWTLAGFVMLILAYVGSRFVLEVILRRI